MESKAIMTKLILAYKEDKDVLDYIKEALDKFPKYVELICQQYTLAETGKYSLEREDLLNKVKILDDQRRRTHNVIISSIKKINELCIENNLDLFYKGNIDDRAAIGDFVFYVVEHTFKNRER